MNILFVGDIVGKPGRELVRKGLSAIVAKHRIDLVVANVENAAAGFGITRELGETFLRYGVDVMTSGNHVWDKKEALEYIQLQPRLVRPANFPDGTPGSGRFIVRHPDGTPAAGVINVMGRIFMMPLDNPFSVVLQQIEAVRALTPVIVVDFHAEATSEKNAMGWHLDGKVTAVIGTHTHVQTADNRILPGGTAYITDVGMTGPHDSVIGVVKEAAVSRFINGLPVRFDSASGDPRLHAVVIAADPDTGRATSIERVSLSLAELEAFQTPAALVN